MQAGKRQDSLHRFLFEQQPVRGELVHLDASWQAALERCDYPAPVRSLLGEAMAAAVLMASTLKFEGRMTLQIQGDGPVSLLVVQCDSDLVLRGTAKFREDIPTDSGFHELLGEGGHMAITIDSVGSSERYQGLVPLEGESIATCLEDYFARSEQLPTRLWLAADGEVAAGLLLQVVPEQGAEDDDTWNRATTLADTVTGDELCRLPVRDLLHRLYHEESLRLFEAHTVAFRCSCSREKTADVLRRLGRGEVDDILEEQGRIEVGCEFCGRKYRYDQVDAEDLFTDPAQSQSSTRRH